MLFNKWSIPVLLHVCYNLTYPSVILFIILRYSSHCWWVKAHVSLSYTMYCVIMLLAVVPRSKSSLPKHAYHPRRNQARSERRQGDCWETAGKEVMSTHLPTEPCYGEGNWICQVFRMFSSNTERSKDGIWWSDKSGFVS